MTVFKRGDGVLFIKKRRVAMIGAEDYDRVQGEVGMVISVTREGHIKSYVDAKYGQRMDIRHQAGAEQYVMPQGDWDIEGVMHYCRNRPWSHNPEHTGAPFDSLKQAREELRQFRLDQKFGGAVDHRRPRTRTEAISALSMRRGTGQVRTVLMREIHLRKGTSNIYPVNVSEGNSLTVVVETGLPRLVLESGEAEFRLHSVWGNSLTIRPGARAKVITNGEVKVTIENEGSLILQAPRQNRVHISGPGDVVGDWLEEGQLP
ncbi:hypothetical protein SEA_PHRAPPUCCINO_16 [Mycobacterium phage Phrappuccino]|uniref:Uncharacterized protein n=1 Tax=Mycobacterium phage Phrappuccino TaxID=2591223 RepID=A0A514DDL3_9CAUD|nr:hypothetical protein KHQ87_gp016 [Mycobacterium phage Phrappuccino]QDH91694.1 hypothetical protein SEA_PHRAPPUCCINO_16 [Mycobacterium phage Phrappuccino]QIQ63138.1 hypothetical protein SEA_SETTECANDELA_16 [Mycobacterium phage Settecandela]